MKTTFKTYITAVLAFMLLPACRPQGSSDEIQFISGSKTPSLTVSGEVRFKYEEKTHQLAYNGTEGQFRIMSDKADKFLVVSLGESVTKMGESVSCSIAYTYNGSVEEIKDDFTIANTESTEEGKKVWLWNESLKTGVIILYLN